MLASLERPAAPHDEPQVFEQPKSAGFRLRRCGKCGNEYDGRDLAKCPECANDSGAELGLSLLADFGTRLPKPVETCLACGHDQPELESLLATSLEEAAYLRDELRIARDLYAELREQTAQRRLVESRGKWFEKGSNVAELLRWLTVEGCFSPSDFEEIVSVVAEPWKWEGEYDQMRDVQRERNATSAL